MKFLSKLNTTQKWLLGLSVAFVLYIAFNEMRKADWKATLEKNLAAIDQRMSNGRASAQELIELRMKRKALLQQYLKTI